MGLRCFEPCQCLGLLLRMSLFLEKFFNLIGD